jgi:DNA (cytosine-5)-methyltransferase 1
VLIENDPAACNTLRLNRPHWNVLEHNLFEPLDLTPFKGVDLVAGGLPCPPFSVAGKQLGERDERNLFNIGMLYIDALRPKAIMFENVKGILDPTFQIYRVWILSRLKKMGYVAEWRVINASDFGVPQLRPRAILVAVQQNRANRFDWPIGRGKAPTVGEALYDLMASRDWLQAPVWREQACAVAPTIVGGSKKHGGPDLGPTRARNAWAKLGVNGKSIAESPPERDFQGMPRLTVGMVARLQGFSDDWRFTGKKTAAYRQVGNAFPPPVACAIGQSLMKALTRSRRRVSMP